MPLFRKKPVIIEAIQLNRRIKIETLEGEMVGEPGDWLITGVKGEQYPCKPDIFEETYEAIDDIEEFTEADKLQLRETIERRSSV